MITERLRQSATHAAAFYGVLTNDDSLDECLCPLVAGCATCALHRTAKQLDVTGPVPNAAHAVSTDEGAVPVFKMDAAEQKSIRHQAS